MARRDRDRDKQFFVETDPKNARQDRDTNFYVSAGPYKEQNQEENSAGCRELRGSISDFNPRATEVYPLPHLGYDLTDQQLI
ncbi:hypothetical protein PROFUN_15725 [Planoprotostelium fungivorum]|uniref:Uncharacterized protein n=1 Tax=Planoprotostelium fungivorum TaxID=1890364 RepID=A0A2P6MUK6_9EUKA|nr:hypothetical protein PROFUN_15725 [Planoprotostelium fungivorum]